MLHLWRSSDKRVVVVVLSGDRVQPLFEALDHLVTLRLVIDELLVQDFVHARNWLLNLRQHDFQFSLKLRHDLVSHGVSELRLDHFPDGLVRELSCRSAYSRGSLTQTS